MLELAAHILSVLVMIAWALAWPTVWALVGGALIANAIKMAGSHYLARDRRDRLRWDKDAVHALYSFGRWIFLSTILAFLAGQADRLIFGKLVTLQELGVYSIAAMLATSASLLNNRIGVTVVFPAFSRALEGRGDFSRVYRRSKRSLIALCGFMVVLLVSSGIPMVEFLYDERYAAAGLFLQILALAAWCEILEVPPGAAVLAWGKPSWLAVASACKLVGMAVLMPLGFQVGGFVGAIGGFVAAEVARYALMAGVAYRSGGRGLGIDACATAGLALAAAAGMQLAALVPAESTALARFAASAAAALAVWSPVAALLAWSELSRMLGSLWARWPGRPPA